MKKILFIGLSLAAMISCSRAKETIEYGDYQDNTPENPTKMAKVIYGEDHTIISNPERGFCTRDGYHSRSSVISDYEINTLKSSKHTLVFFDFKLKEFISSPINSDMLGMMQRNFDKLRANGIKAVVRFTYSSSTSAAVYDAEPSIVLKHISQLKPILEKNKDVIALIEAGFIGAYGEWYYSTHYGNKGQADYAKRRIIVNAMLDAFPKERMIAVRTPLIKTNLLNISLNSPLTQSEAFNRSNKARLGHHNDCFLADEKDRGTYTGEQDKKYTQLDSKYTVVGGETCTPPTSYSQCNAALQTMGKYHWSYLNLSYHQDMIADWKNTHCFEEIQKRLGYRFVMKEVQYTEKMESGKNYKMVLNFENKGFASPYNPRSVYIKFRSVSDGRIHFSHQIQSNPQFWFTGNHRLEISINLPSHLPAGDYDVLLHLPDASMSIADKAEYAVRFANINTWEAATGYNKLYTQTKK